MDFSRVVGLHKSVVDCYKAWGQKRADRAAERKASADFPDPELVFYLILFVFETSEKRDWQRSKYWLFKVCSLLGIGVVLKYDLSPFFGLA